MFGRKKKPKCPVGETDQQWLEDYWLRLCGAFGADEVHQATVFDSTKAYRSKDKPFDSYTADLLEQFCPVFGLDHTAIAVGTFEDERPETQADMDDETDRHAEKGVALMWLPAAVAPDPQFVAVGILQQLAMWSWPEETFEFDDEVEMRQVAELTALQKGFGVILANAAISDEAWNNGMMGGWHTYRRTQLLVYHLGYALALFATTRGETRPNWESELCTDARHGFRGGMEYLEATKPTANTD